MIETHYVQQFIYSALPFDFGSLSLNQQGLADDVIDTHARVQRRIGVLEHHLALNMILAGHLVILVSHQPVIEVDLTRRESFNTDQHSPDRGLAATRFSHETEGLALVDREAHVGNRVHRTHLVLDQSGLDGELLHHVLNAREFLVRRGFDRFRSDGRRDDRRERSCDGMKAGELVPRVPGELRVLLAALVSSVGAARREATRDNHLREVRRHAGDRNQLLLRGRFEARHRGEQRLGVGVSHRLEQFVGG